MAIKWNNKIMFPTDSCFRNRITGVQFGPSNNSGNPMITIDCEVVSPETVEVGTEVVNIAGVPTKNYFVTKVIHGDDAESKTVEAQKKVKEFLSNHGIDVTNLNWDNLGPQLQPLLGKITLTEMSPEVVEKTKNPTQAQIAEGIKNGIRLNQIKGDIMKHPITNKPLIDYWPRIVQFFGLAPDQAGAVNMPY